MKTITTIKLEKQTKSRLTRLKEHERETYDQVIKKILYILNRIRKDPISGNRLLGKIDANIRRGQIYKKDKEDDEK
jgi:hypothetical protein